MTNHTFAIAIHGGAGTILRKMMTAAQEREYRTKLEESLHAGHAVLAKGGRAIDAVQASVRVMEDSPLFNAGKGAVFTHEGYNEQDACIMDGSTRAAGAVAGVRRLASPITVARLVMEKSPHVLLGGEGAERFAESQGITLVDKEYFYTEHRWNQLQQALRREQAQQQPQTQLDHSDDKAVDNAIDKDLAEELRRSAERDKIGTVGAVAVDQHGNLAAATSTGGMTNKRFGRIGDTPIIGAGTYADNATCAVSATGVGEFFMRGVTAYDLAALMMYKQMSLAEASSVVMRKLADLGGTGGLAAIDRNGHIAQPFNSEGMYRGWMKADGAMEVKIFRE